jgi:MYXO-CTERM domain-containing protein
LQALVLGARLAHLTAVRRFLHLLATVSLLTVTAPSVARAYDNHFTHPWITRQAAERLVAAYPGQYDEILQYIDDVAWGARDEDNFLLDGDDDIMTLRVMRHFFRPTDGRGLTWGDRLFPSSYDWCAVESEQNAWDWFDGMRQYRQGDKRAAYETLGHVVHLIQDATVPAHTHLDDHGPPDGDDYEDWVAEQFDGDELHSRLPLPANGAPIPQFTDPWDGWQQTAWASYRRNLYRGDLSDPDGGATGAIAEMYPDLHWSFWSENWTIGDPAVGDLGSDFFEHEPGLYYFKNAEHAPLLDKAAFDPYSHGMGSEPLGPSGGVPMVEAFARDLIPVAVLHTAGMMKLYLDRAYAQAPELPETPEPDPEPASSTDGGCSVGEGTAPTPFALLLFVLVALPFARRKP